MGSEQNLSRKERRALGRELKKNKHSSGLVKKVIALGAGLLLIGLLGYWIYSGAGKSGKPLPGEAVANLGREHITDIYGIEYNSNPPTSGKHFPMWAKKGMYDRLLSDGYLIHSLEHGYVIVSYDCAKLSTSSQSLVPNVYAHDGTTTETADSNQKLMHMNLSPTPTMSAFTPENPPEVEVTLPDEFNLESCKSLQSNLQKLLDFRERVIVVPRLEMETPIAVTAWGRILKLDSFNQQKIEEFISAFHNKGPENTVE